jgi:hypothetical protein
MNNEELTSRLREKLRSHRSALQAKARRLSESMDDLANRLDTDDPCLNACGEIQGDATRIDTLCAEIGTLTDVLRWMGEPEQGTMKREEQRAAAIERRLAAYEEELEQTYDEDLEGLDLDVLRLEHQARVEHARTQIIATLLEERKAQLEGMPDEELLKEDDEE